MGKAITALILVAGLWVGLEFFTYGPSRAFDGAFASFFSEGPASPDNTRTTAQRAGDSVRQSQAEATARRERLLAE